MRILIVRFRAIVAVVVPIAVVAVTSRCGTSASTPDANVFGDVQLDSPLACASDVSSFKAENMGTPHAPHLNQCTLQQIADYAQCQGAKDTTKCPQFGAGKPSAACGTCIESQHNGPDGGTGTWGVIVFNGSSGSFNIAGCVDDALGQVAAEPTSCGQALYASYTCQEAACSACVGSDYTDCDNAILLSGCAGEEATVNNPSGPCTSLFSDALAGDLASCFPDSTLASDATKQEVDWLTRIITYMCGP